MVSKSRSNPQLLPKSPPLAGSHETYERSSSLERAPETFESSRTPSPEAASETSGVTEPRSSVKISFKLDFNPDSWTIKREETGLTCSHAVEPKKPSKIPFKKQKHRSWRKGRKRKHKSKKKSKHKKRMKGIMRKIGLRRKRRKSSKSSGKKRGKPELEILSSLETEVSVDSVSRRTADLELARNGLSVGLSRRRGDPRVRSGSCAAKQEVDRVTRSLTNRGNHPLARFKKNQKRSRVPEFEHALEK